MTVYIENVIADNFAMTYMIAQLSYKICGIFAKKRRSVFAASVGSVVALLYPLINNDFALFSVKIALYSVMCLILYVGKNKPIAAAVFLLVTALFGGVAFFISYAVCGSAQRAMREGSEFSPGALIFIGWLAYKIACKAVEKAKRKKLDDHFFTTVIINVLGVEIKAKGLIDSGNRLFDPKTTLPVTLVCENDDVREAIKTKGKERFLGYVRITGVGGSGENVPLYHPDKIEFEKEGKITPSDGDCLIGFCNFLPGDRSIGAIVHPAICGGVK
ncbi:MAG: sigma-E processing peptidase SpoIIGA [Candidatus Neoclostridium sp.]